MALLGNTAEVHVSSEIGTLRKILVHSPDSGLGKVIPSKAQDWLFEDIVHLESMRRNEYDYFTKILLYFLDTEKVRGKIQELDGLTSNRGFYKPDHPNFHKSERVLEFQYLLSQILEIQDVRTRLVASICAVEGCSKGIEHILLKSPPIDLSKTLITGILGDGTMIFAPLPNLIFTRDLGVVIGDHILLNRPAKIPRTREALLTKYIFFHHPNFQPWQNRIIEIPNSEHHFLLPTGDQDFRMVTLEGGDLMMISPRHLLIGCSERTTIFAANQLTKIVFQKNLVNRVTVIKIPRKREFMHIDTIFTQIRRDVWVLLGSLSRFGEELEKKDIMESLLDTHISDQLKILQFEKGKENKARRFEYLEDLLESISREEFGCSSEPTFIYSGNNEFPYGDREQWTDSCNVLALKEGVVIGYDRNTKTAEGFRLSGFQVRNASSLLEELENGKITPDEIRNTLILLPSAELSRARGGPHCMSMPLLREPTTKLP